MLIIDFLQLYWGISDLEISYYPCPDGCSQCQNGDILQVCQQWVKQYDHFSYLSSDLLTNEGWKIIGGNEQFKYQSCLGTPLFGFFLKGQQLQRQFYLDPHYRIRIKFLFFKIDNWKKAKANFFVDSQQLWKYQFDDEDGSKQYNICQSSSEFDDFVKVALTFDHQSQFTNMYFMTDQIISGLTSFGIRDFAIFIIHCPSECSFCNYKTCLRFDNLMAFQISQQYFTEGWFVGSSGWVLQKTQDLSNFITKCGDKSIFGGYEKLGKGLDGQPIYSRKTYFLQAHRMLKFMITLYIIDSMDNGTISRFPPDFGYIAIDSSVIYQKNLGLSIPNVASQDICGNSWPEKIDHSISVLDHSNRQATITIWSGCDQPTNDESFGFRDIELYTGDCDFDCASCSVIQGDACVVTWNLEYRELFQDIFNDAQGWGNPQTITPSKIISDCQGLSILGGDYSMNHDSKVFNTVVLSDHTKLRISLKIFLIGIWNGESIYLLIDGNILYSQQIFSTYFNRLCDTNIVSTAIQIDEVISHFSLSIRIELQSSLRIDSSPDSGFGLRDVVIQQNFI